MDYYMYTIVLALVSFIVIFLSLPRKSNRFQFQLPPGPKPWPIIGNIHLLGDKPHQSVTKLSKIYGPIMSLKLGSVTTIVISSPEIAKEMFVKHDLDLSGRKVPIAAKVQDYHKDSLIWLSVGPKWRELRKIAVMELFTNQRLDLTEGLRRKKVVELVNYARECSERGQAIDIGEAAFTTSLNLLSNTFFSIDLASYHSSFSRELKDLLRHLVEEGGRPNVSDFIPLIRSLDLQGVWRRNKVYFAKVVAVFDKIVDERLTDESDHSKNDVLGTLLKLVKEDRLSLDVIKYLLMDLFVAGTDTTSSTLEWAMTELLRHPEKMKQAQTEIHQIIDRNCSIQESDISKLPYIQAIVKETMRLHPPAPFLPHKAEKDVQLCNYYVPKEAQIWVNVWSMGRDASIWPNAEAFDPERFMERETDVKGRDFELLTFGAGRRVCPGMSLAYRMTHLMLTSLLQSFNWEIANELTSKDLDVDEKFGMTLQKFTPLKVIPQSL